uniref:Uncharacterized protein n=1 Tax=Anguilla anguilla TaxID=7936 RepID=A0A0E9WN20_ANGAN
MTNWTICGPVTCTINFNFGQTYPAKITIIAEYLLKVRNQTNTIDHRDNQIGC